MQKILIICLLLACLSMEALKAQKTDSNTENKSLWKGFERLDFKCDGRDARLIIPAHPLPGNPWVWRARFPDWHTKSDSILISRGFHVAYINTDNQYGSPAAMTVWNAFYDYMTQTHQLKQKVALVGVSRGGLFVYNWAKQNPEKVACIYAEAPVCDFKSWPAAFGLGKGSEEDWKRLKVEYGFKSNAIAKRYLDNPMDNLESLAVAKVPVLHMIGLEDKIVPPEENTFTLIDRYVKLGGIAAIVSCTQGKQTLEGHHFPIETPDLVADFIHYNSVQNCRLINEW